MQKLIFLILFLNSNFLKAEIVPYFGTNSEINFGAILFVQGNCTMHHETGEFSNISPAVMCGISGKGVPGRYAIVANPNQLIRIKILQRNNQGDGLMFIPEGELVSDAETLAITAGTVQEINSGTSGVINILMGGRLSIISPITPGSNIEFIRADGIEWSVLP